jgi:glutamate formiminotransferase
VVDTPRVFAECVVNISEGRDRPTIDAVAAAAGATLLDVHADGDHHRTVVTLGGPLPAVEDAARRVVETAVTLIDLSSHRGVHPRMGVADVVPFVPLPPTAGTAAVSPEVVAARDRLADWAGSNLRLPCFLYGPERSLPEVRRWAFDRLRPDRGPDTPHPTAGATAVGARQVLVAYNVWIVTTDPEGDPRALSVARTLARGLRGPAVRALGLAAGSAAQVSFNIVDTAAASPLDLYDRVATGAEALGCGVLRAELVGLLPSVSLDAVPRHRLVELDLAVDRTIESRMEERWPGFADPAGPG